MKIIKDKDRAGAASRYSQVSRNSNNMSQGEMGQIVSLLCFSLHVLACYDVSALFLF